jgi:hypothetical protein
MGKSLTMNSRNTSSKNWLASTYKTKKWKRDCIDTYSDLMDGAFMVSNEDKHSDEENWVSRKGFAV